MVYAVNAKHVEIFMGTKKKTSLKFKLAHNLSVRISQSFKAQIKKNKTRNFVGCSQSSLKGWIVHQLYGEVSIENNRSVWSLDRTYPL